MLTVFIFLIICIICIKVRVWNLSSLSYYVKKKIIFCAGNSQKFAQVTSWPLPLKGVSQLVTKWLVTSWLLECGYEWTSRVRVDLGTSRSGYELTWYQYMDREKPVNKTLMQINNI